MFCRKNKKYYFAKKWECHGTPGVDGPALFKINPCDKNKLYHSKLSLYTHSKHVYDMIRTYS